jgi:Protein of Unknown function (DUF2784)
MDYAVLAELILAVHLAIILFNVGGLIIIPLGAWRHWRFVRGFWWRALHLASLAVVALQAVLGQVCFLKDWQGDLLRAAGAGATREPLIAGLVNRLIYWPLPLWVFAALYVAVWLYVLLLWWLVPPHRGRMRQIDSGSEVATRRR